MTDTDTNQLDLAAVKAQHQPNTPRTHDAAGRKVTDPVQCVKDAHTWPCLPYALADRAEAAEAKVKLLEAIAVAYRGEKP